MTKEPKWTKGPWYSKGYMVGTKWLDDKVGGILTEFVADAKNPPNARLLSAAPDMADNHIAVCQEVIEWKDDPDYEDGGYYCLTKSKYDDMCSALSKALGETE